jgi:hypothetical protein
MRKELDEKLCAEYPLIFRDRHGDMSQTCMVWGFDCDDGWYNIIDAMCANIQCHIDNRLENIKWAEKWNATVNDLDHEWTGIVERKEREVPKPVEQVVAIQVKEKFGTLRFYFGGGDAYTDGIVSMAESMSGRTCEVCGAPGTGTKGRWIRTLCEEHVN